MGRYSTERGSIRPIFTWRDWIRTLESWHLSRGASMSVGLEIQAGLLPGYRTARRSLLETMAPSTRSSSTHLLPAKSASFGAGDRDERPRGSLAGSPMDSLSWP